MSFFTVHIFECALRVVFLFTLWITCISCKYTFIDFNNCLWFFFSLSLPLLNKMSAMLPLEAFNVIFVRAEALQKERNKTFIIKTPAGSVFFFFLLLSWLWFLQRTCRWSGSLLFCSNFFFSMLFYKDTKSVHCFVAVWRVKNGSKKKKKGKTHCWVMTTGMQDVTFWEEKRTPYCKEELYLPGQLVCYADP